MLSNNLFLSYAHPVRARTRRAIVLYVCASHICAYGPQSAGALALSTGRLNRRGLRLPVLSTPNRHMNLQRT
jgi:hypothetical protein